MISITPRDFDYNKAEEFLCANADQRRLDQMKRKLDRGRFIKAENQLAKRIGPVQLLAQSDWTDASVFEGATIPNLCHPHHRWLWHRVLKHYKKRSDTLVVVSCFGGKPYSRSVPLRELLVLAQKGWFDLAVISFHPVPIVPLDASTMYPNMLYDWPHPESDAMMHLESELSASYWVQFLAQNPYEKVVFCLNQYKPHVDVMQKLRSVFPEIKMPNMWDDWPPFHSFIDERYHGLTIWKFRYHNFKVLRSFISHELGDPEQFRKDANLEK